jgi:hypothetical protein
VCVCIFLFPHTHIHTHTSVAGVQHMGHILVVPMIIEAQLPQTHKCPQGENSMNKVG